MRRGGDAKGTLRGRLAAGHHLLASVHPWDKGAVASAGNRESQRRALIRPNTGIVEGLAFLYRFGTYDEKTVGVGRDRLRETIHGMMRYLVATHVTGTRPTDDGRPWGDVRQSAHWTQRRAGGVVDVGRPAGRLARAFGAW